MLSQYNLCKNTLFDTHLHTSFSSDCDIPAVEMIERAITLGCSSVCITDHYDLDWPITKEHPQNFLFDVPSYLTTLQQLQASYADRMDIRIGVELGLQPHLADDLQAFVHEHSFDYIIGSSHLVNHKDPWYKEYFEGRKASAAYEEYFQSILDNLAVFSNIDAYGHLDYVVRYGPNQKADYSYGRFADLLDEILHTLVAKDIALEVNTGGYKYGLGVPNPDADIIKRYLALGGEKITIGSDAHHPDYLCYEFSKCHDYLRSCGVRYLTRFVKRQPEFIKL